MGAIRNAYIFSLLNLNEINRLDNLGIDENIRMDPRKIGCKGVDWIHLAQDTDQWRALVNVVMNVWVP
jgi:hypothetical protein